MGQFSSVILVPEAKACTNHTDPRKPNWITIHAVAAELSIAEVERLWLRFKQLGCTDKGEIHESDLTKHPIYQDAFSRNILKKFMYPKSKIITFENFLRGLKWCEMSNTEDKLRGIFRMLNNGNDVPKDIFKKIIERVYVQPSDQRSLDKVINTLYKQLDPNNKGIINEDQFVRGCISIPQDMLEQALNFEVLPTAMKEELHDKLPEVVEKAIIAKKLMKIKGFNSGAGTPAGDGGNIPTDNQLKRVAENIHRKDWARLANKLDFTNDDLDDICDQYSDKRQQVYVMLRKWKQREGNQATSSTLAQALREVKMDQAAALLN